MTHLYFATGGSATLDAWDWDAHPINLLVALPYVRSIRRTWRPRRMMLDSGAFTAWKSGLSIDLAELARESKKPRWTEAVALDDITSWQRSRSNAIAMRALGSPAFPVFHIGEPWELLDFYCGNWPKVGLGGMVGLVRRRELTKWLEGVFARAWPALFHAFGVTHADVLLHYPFDSADSSTWQTASKYGRMIRLGRRLNAPIVQVDVSRASGAAHEANKRRNILNYLDLEQRLAAHWARELAAARAT